MLAVVTLGAEMWSQRQASQEAEEKAKAAEERDAKYVSDFERVLLAIAELEAISEIYYQVEVEAEEKFSASYKDGDSTARFEQLGGIWYDEAWDAQDIFNEDIRRPLADLDAQPLKAQSTNGDLDAVRDAAVAHYRAWQDSLYPYVTSIDNWIFTDSCYGTFYECSSNELDPLSEAISETFYAMCAKLSDEQPADGQFSARIASECES